MTRILTPVLIAPISFAFTSMLEKCTPSATPAAVLWPQDHALNAQQKQYLLAMGHPNPPALAMVLDSDGYGMAGFLHICAQAVWMSLRNASKDAHWARDVVRAWRWWVLRDGLVGMPYTDRDRFLSGKEWGGLQMPIGHTGVPVLLFNEDTMTAHQRLGVAARVVEDLHIVCTGHFPNAQTSSPLWLS